MQPYLLYCLQIEYIRNTNYIVIEYDYYLLGLTYVLTFLLSLNATCRFYIVIRGSVGVYVREISKKHRKRKAIVVRLPRITSESNTSHKTGENTHFPGCPARHGVLNHHQEVPHDFCHKSDDDNHMKELEMQYGPKVNVLRKLDFFINIFTNFSTILRVFE